MNFKGFANILGHNRLSEEEIPADREHGNMELSDWKRQILDDFRLWLEQVDDGLADGDDLCPDSESDLLSLIGEMTALRQEVKIMGRSSSKLLGAVEGVSAAVSDKVLPLADEIRSVGRDSRRVVELNALRPLLLEIGDLAELVKIELAEIDEPVYPWYVPRRIRNLCRAERQREVLETLEVRIDSVLERYEMKAVAHINDKFDSVRMTAIDTSCDGNVDQGCVSAVVKQGFFVAGDILRTAQVVVEKEEE